jgi:uncharacterized NAD(P)/FAD-binding protein YdhS
LIHDLVIVGGGFAGLCLLTHLDEARVSGSVAMLEPAGALPAGVAYATCRPEHLLNVRARRMGLLHSAPEGYAHWLAGAEGAAAAARWGAPTDARAFTPRGLYREYLAAQARALALPFVLIAAHAGAIHQEVAAWRIETTQGPIRARQIALCTGLALRRQRSAPASYAEDPARLDYDAVARAAGRDSVCVVLGTALSALDALASLDEAGWPGRIVLVSRDGRFPEPHDESGVALAPDPALAAIADPGARLIALLRQARAMGAPWQAAVDALRPDTPALWRALPDKAKARLVARWGDRWNRLRHRAPGESLNRAQRWIDTGKAEVLTGCIETIGDAGVQVRLAGGVRDIPAELVIEARGLASAWRDNPLLAQLVADGVAAPGPLGWGLAADAGGVIATAPFGAIFGIGPVLLGAAYETTGAPEIRAQAASLATMLARRGADATR